jgi:hypothetical protein
MMLLAFIQLARIASYSCFENISYVGGNIRFYKSVAYFEILVDVQANELDQIIL